MRKKSWSRRPISAIRQSRGWTAVIFAAFVLIIVRFVGLYAIWSTYAFYDIANSSAQGTVEYSQETTNPCGTYMNNVCISTTSCLTTVSFTPLNQSTSYTTTDNLCDAPVQGTTVEVLYDSHDPSIAKTARQALADIVLAIGATISLSTFVLVVIINRIKNIYYVKGLYSMK